MKKIFSIAGVVVLLIACKKGNTNTNDNLTDTVAVNTIVATIGDSTYTFSKKIIDTVDLKDPVNNGLDEIILTASIDTSVHAKFLSILLFSSDIDTAKTYTDKNPYTDGFGNIYYALNNITGFEFPFDQKNESNPITIKVTSVSSSSTSIKGTFKGTLYLEGDIDSAKVVVTNGKFNFRK